jgi:hypothetical protein
MWGYSFCCCGCGCLGFCCWSESAFSQKFKIQSNHFSLANNYDNTRHNHVQLQHGQVSIPRLDNMDAPDISHPLCQFLYPENCKMSQFRFKWTFLVPTELIYNPKHVQNVLFYFSIGQWSVQIYWNQKQKRYFSFWHQKLLKCLSFRVNNYVDQC